MSRLKLKNGDDHPEAAQKHIIDAEILLANNRYDGAAYHSGYVIESSLKSIFHLENGYSPWGHDLPELHRIVGLVATVAGSRSARYFGQTCNELLASSIIGWDVEMRYKAPLVTEADAIDWYRTSAKIFNESVAKMFLDGAI
jgi:HEPN domain-containing protein